MRDFTALVRARVEPLALPPERRQKIVEEWSAQLADVYRGLRAEGLSEQDAWLELERLLPDATELGSELGAGARPLQASRTDAEPGLNARVILGRLRGRIAGGLLRDLRASVRLAARDPGFSATVVLTLAICLGANAAIFTVVNAVLLRPLPVPEPDRIVGMGDVYPTITPNDILSNDVPSYFDRLEALTTLDEQAMFTFWFDTVVIDGVPRELRGMRVTPSLFRLLRVPPSLGRTFTDDEGEAGNDRRIVLSHALWQSLFGGDRGVLGRTVQLGWTGERYTVVGVMPRDFSFFDQGYDGHASPADSGLQFWIPMVFTAAQRSDSGRTRYGFYHIGRLRPGATVQQVQAQLDALHAATVARFPQFRLAELGMYSSVTPLQEALTRRIRPTLYLLWAGAGFVLLIGAINIANLALARAAARRRELATRLALGASRLQVARQLMIEAIVPAALGAAAALGVGAGILEALVLAGMENLPNAAAARIDLTTVGFVAGAAVLVALLIGLAPATTAAAVTISQVLGDGSRSGTAGRSARLFRRALVVTQVALSVLLLIAATLLLGSFRHLLGIDAGFTATGVVTGTLFPPPSRYPDRQAVVALTDAVLERVRQLPGVEAAGMTSNIALSGYESPSTVTAAGPSPESQPALVPSVIAVTPGYFEAMETPTVRGRAFAVSDREDTQPVAIVDERLAARLWPGEDPIGRAIYRGDAGPFTVVGVVGEVRFEGLVGRIESIGTAYFPHTQLPSSGRLRWMAVRSTLGPQAAVRAVRTALLEIDPELPLSDVQTMDERTARSLASQRLASTLAALFAVIALFLSMLGLYGVLANLVARRTREIGIRLALGSTVRAIYYLVLSEGLVLVGTGLVLGLAGALLTARSLEGLLFGIRPTDPVLLGMVAALGGGVALLACVAPARRAARVDPVDVLSEP